MTAVRRVQAGESVLAVAEELGIRRKRLYVWKDRYAEWGEAGLRRVWRKATERSVGSGKRIGNEGRTGAIAGEAFSDHRFRLIQPALFG